LRSLQDRALRLGARILARGAAADAPASCLFPLTVVQAAENTTSALDREEAFGPLVEGRAIGSIEHAVAYIAQERHALAAYVYGADAGLKPQILARWRFGSIGFDTVRIQSPATPTGGFGLAGHGREGGTYGLREYLTTRNICEPL
jgi:succinate-semialdehyde dehydrogenase/glutarate-semialdehyde dehydrogenase